jgi:hypothetical protein
LRHGHCGLRSKEQAQQQRDDEVNAWRHGAITWQSSGGQQFYNAQLLKPAVCGRFSKIDRPELYGDDFGMPAIASTDARLEETSKPSVENAG